MIVFLYYKIITFFVIVSKFHDLKSKISKKDF